MSGKDRDKATSGRSGVGVEGSDGAPMGTKGARGMFANSRAEALAAIERMGIACCAYSGTSWAERCDCKYGVAEAQKWPHVSERGNGCPELRTLHSLVSEMTDEEYGLLTLRAGDVPRGALFGAGDIAARLHQADAAASMAQANIAAVREALDQGRWR